MLDLTTTEGAAKLTRWVDYNSDTSHKSHKDEGHSRLQSSKIEDRSTKAGQATIIPVVTL